MSTQNRHGVIRIQSLRKGVLVEDRLGFLEELSLNRSVLHIGCVDSGATDEKLGNNTLLHARLARVASELYGLDIDSDGLEQMRALGYGNLFHADIEVPIPIKKRFDVVIAGEVIEHLGRPMAFLEQVKELLSPSGVLVITVPNAFSVAGFVNVCLGAEVVHRDHVSYYSPVTIESLLTRAGLVVEKLIYCSDVSRLKGFKYIRKKIINWLVVRNRIGLAEVVIVISK